MMLAISSETITAVVVAVLGGGLITAAVALFKFPRENDRVAVSASEGAIIVQSSVIKDLRTELDRVSTESATNRERLDELETENRDLHDRLSRAEADKANLAVENEKLTARVAHLEAEIAELRGPVRTKSGELIERRETPP